jgi:hypothetical protein
MGHILSRIELDKKGIRHLDFGREYLNEPSDYYDFIEFGDIDGYGGEIVVASKTQKRFVSKNNEYSPGGRIYIRKESLMKLDGYVDFLDHYCVKGMVELANVEYEIIEVNDFNERKWTPRIFLEAANELFKQRIEEKLKKIPETSPNKR